MIEKRDIINLIAKTMGFVINVVITFFLTSFIVKNVGAEAYGFVGLANDFISYIQILTIALNSMASRFITIEFEKNNLLNVRQYYSSLLVMNIFVSMVIAVIGVIFVFNIGSIINIGSVQIFDVQILWLFLLANFLMTLMGTVFQVATFCKRRLELEAIRTVAASVLKAIILIVCYVFFKIYIWYIGMATLLSGMYSLIYNVKYTRQLMPDAEISIKYFDIRKIITLVKSGFWNSLTQLGAVLLNGLDLIVTNLFVGSAAMGTMSISKTFPKYILNMFATMASAFTPNFVISVAKKNNKELCLQLASSIRILSLISSIPMVVLFVCGKQLFGLWVPSEDTMVLYNITVISCASYVILLPLEPVWNVFTALNKLKVTSIYLLIESIASIGIELLLLGFMNNDHEKLYIIAGVSSLFIIFRSLVFLPIYTGKCIHESCSFFYRIIWKNILTIICSYFIGLQFVKSVKVNSWISLFGAAVVVIVITIIIGVFVILTNQERSMIVDKWKNKIKKG